MLLTHYFGRTTSAGSTNSPPVVVDPIPDQVATPGTPFLFTFDPGVFSDPDLDLLTYSADQSDGSPLPGWLSFDPGSRTFEGTPPEGSDDVLSIRVTASDGEATSSDAFELVIGVCDIGSIFGLGRVWTSRVWGCAGGAVYGGDLIWSDRVWG